MTVYPRKLVMSAGHHHFFHRTGALVAAKRGYFREEGLLDFEINALGGDEKVLASVIDGSTQIGLDVRSEILLRENSKGKDVYIIGGMINKLATDFFGAREIKSIQDLKGKKVCIGTSGMGIAVRPIRKWLRQAGLDPDKDVILTLTAERFPTIALEGPRMDAGEFQGRTIVRFSTEEAIKQGYNLLGRFEDIYPEGWPQRVIATTGKIVNQYPETIMAFLRGMIRAYRFVRLERNWEQVKAAIAELATDKDWGWAEMDHAFMDKQYPFCTSLTTDGSITKVGFGMVVAEDKAEGKLPKSYSGDRALRLEFVEKAVKDVNRRFGPEGYE